MKKIHLLLCAAALLTACQNGNPSSSSAEASLPESENVASVEITLSLSASSLSLKEGETANLKAESNARSVVFSSDDPSIASVSSAGLILAKKAGNTTIRAKAGDKEATCAVTVLAEDAGDKISVPEKVTAIVGSDPVDIGAKLLKNGQEDASATFTYASSDETIATVSVDGKLTAVSAGQAEITVSSGDSSATLLADVYTGEIKTPQQWLAMFSHGAEWGIRYTVTADLDFTGTSYIGPGLAAGVESDTPFCAEVSGNRHILKNIFFPSGLVGTVSLFGPYTGAYVHDLSFENVTFPSDCAASIFSPRAKKDNGGSHAKLDANGNRVSMATRFENVFVEAELKSSFYGLAERLYGCDFSEVFVSLKTEEGHSLSSSNPAISVNPYNWGGSLIEGMVIYCQGQSLVDFTNPGDMGSKTIDLGKYAFASAKMEAIYQGYRLLSSDVWDFSSNALPSLKAAE